MAQATFEWDEKKKNENLIKHGITFDIAQLAFLDPNRIIAEDLEHSVEEKRYLCIGKVDKRILNVRFTYRKNRIRIFGAGYWRKEKKAYEKKNKIH